MSNQIKHHKRTMKRFRMICNSSGSVYSFKAINLTTAMMKARKFFNGPVSLGGVMMD